MITSRDVARLAGVSQPTVSRALRADPRVSVETRTRVEEAARTLNYVPSQVGRSLSTRSTSRVAMVADLGNPLYPYLMGPVHEALDRAGYRMVLFAEHGDAETAYDRLFDQSVDGVVLTTVRIGSSLPAALTRRRIPYALLTRTTPGQEDFSCVADNAGGAAEVARRFLADGHTRIAGLLGPEQTSTSRERERGFREALADAGIALSERYVRRDWYLYDSGFAGFTSLLAERPAPTAVFCANDVVATGALNAAHALGVRVPDDVSVIGFDNLPVSRWPVFDLTTVQVPLVEMSHAAVDLLLAQLGGEVPSGGPQVFDTEMLLRSTHGPAAS